VHLLPGFDEFVLGYTDRTAQLAPEHAGRTAITVRVSAFDTFGAATMRAVRRRLDAYAEFLQTEVVLAG